MVNAAKYGRFDCGDQKKGENYDQDFGKPLSKGDVNTKTTLKNDKNIVNPDPFETMSEYFHGICNSESLKPTTAGGELPSFPSTSGVCVCV